MATVLHTAVPLPSDAAESLFNRDDGALRALEISDCDHVVKKWAVGNYAKLLPFHFPIHAAMQHHTRCLHSWGQAETSIRERVAASAKLPDTTFPDALRAVV